MNLTVSLDPGQRVDPAALVIVERLETVRAEPLADRGSRFDVVHAQQWALGTPHPQVVDDVVQLMNAPPLSPWYPFCFDETGIGAAYADLFHMERVKGRLSRPIGVTITGGTSSNGRHVSKRMMVGRYEAKLSSGLIAIRDISMKDEIAKQHERFRASISRNGTDTYAAEGTDHDDLILALMICTYGGGMGAGQPRYLARNGQIYESFAMSNDAY